MADEQEQKQDLIAAAKQLPPMEVFSLKPRTFDEAFRFANLIAESDLVPKEFQKKPANVLVAVQLGMELGVSPMQALQSMYVVNGRPSIFGDLLPAIVFASGLCEQFDEEYDPEKKIATCTVKRRGFKAITRTFSWEDAMRAKGYEGGRLIPLAEKQTYQSYPQRMLPMRARAYAMRDGFPDVLKGVAIYEEVQDEPPAIEIEKQPPIAIPQAKQQSGTVVDLKAKGKTNGETGKPVVETPVSAQAVDGIRERSERGSSQAENASGADARESGAPNGKSEPEKEPQKAQAGSEPAKQPTPLRDAKGRILPKGTEPDSLKDDLLKWMKNATTDDLKSKDHEVCFIRKVFGDSLLLQRLSEDEKKIVLKAYEAEVLSRP